MDMDKPKPCCCLDPFLGWRFGLALWEKASPGFDLEIINDEGEISRNSYEEGILSIRVAVGESGGSTKMLNGLTLHSPVGLFKGYLNDEERTRESFVVIKDGVLMQTFYLTGDRVYKDPDDYLWYVSRADDVIISSGYRIGPFEVESALITHPLVVESAVIGVDDSTRGMVVKAFVVLADKHKDLNMDKTELALVLQEHVKMQTSPYKYPRVVEFVDSLPKTSSGKIRRVELRERERAKRVD